MKLPGTGLLASNDIFPLPRWAIPSHSNDSGFIHEYLLSVDLLSSHNDIFVSNTTENEQLGCTCDVISDIFSGHPLTISFTILRSSE